MRDRVHTLALLSLLAAGCAYSTSAEPPLHAALETERLVQQGPPSGHGVALRAYPVQLGTWVGPGELPGKGVAPVALRVPQAGVPTTHWFVSPTVEPTLVTSQIWPRFDLHTVPMLPYGSFWLEVTNDTDAPVELDAKHLELEVAGSTMRALADPGEVTGRWSLTTRALWHIRESMPVIDTQLINLQVALPRLDRPVHLAAGATWKGYVAFDIGNRFTADEYNALLRRDGEVKISLRGSAGELASVAFKTSTQAIPAVCLPGTKTPSFERCEILTRPDTPIATDNATRDAAVTR